MKNKTLMIILILFLAVIAFFAISKYAAGGKGLLVTPGLRSEAGKAAGQSAVTPAPTPQTPSYNPPQEIKYDSATDLKKELESINPQVQDSDFNE